MTTEVNFESLMGVTDLAKHFDVVPDTIRIWRHRYDDFPEPVTKAPWPVYRLGDVWEWVLVNRPDRALMVDAYLHTFVVGAGGLEFTKTSHMGPLCEARGYVKAIKDFNYLSGRWKVWSTREGFVASFDATTHIYALSPSEEPEPWWTYEQRLKAAKA